MTPTTSFAAVRHCRSRGEDPGANPGPSTESPCRDDVAGLIWTVSEAVRAPSGTNFLYSQEVQPTVPTRADFSRPLKYDTYPCRLQSTAGKELQNRGPRVRILPPLPTILVFRSGDFRGCLESARHTSPRKWGQTDVVFKLTSSAKPGYGGFDRNSRMWSAADGGGVGRSMCSAHRRSCGS